jgi:hypothetical protein
MTRDVRRAMYQMTCAERELYHAIGGVIPREIPPHVCSWWKLGEPLATKGKRKDMRKRRKPKPQVFACGERRKRRKAA